MVRFFRGVQLLGQAIVEPDVPLAELAETAGVVIPTNCTSGTCGTCMITLLKGDVPLPEEIPPGLDEDTIRAFVSSLDIPDEAKAQLMALTPQTYLGNATDQAKAVDR